MILIPNHSKSSVAGVFSSLFSEENGGEVLSFTTMYITIHELIHSTVPVEKERGLKLVGSVYRALKITLYHAESQSHSARSIKLLHLESEVTAGVTIAGLKILVQVFKR